MYVKSDTTNAETISSQCLPGAQVILPVEQGAGSGKRRRVEESRADGGDEGDEEEENVATHIIRLFFFTGETLRSSVSLFLSSPPPCLSFRPKRSRLSTARAPSRHNKNMAKRNVLLLLLAALVAAVGVALIASPATVAAARALLDWEDDLRPKAGDHSSDDSDYKLIDINYPCEELAKWSVGEFNERRLGPRVSSLVFEIDDGLTSKPIRSIDKKTARRFCCLAPACLVAIRGRKRKKSSDGRTTSS